MNNNTHRATEIFHLHRNLLDDMTKNAMESASINGRWTQMLREASKDLKEWEIRSGKKQAYTSNELAYARLARETANNFERKNDYALYLSDAQHQANIAYEILASGLAEKMIAEGQQGRKMGIVELSARLMPALTFTGSSQYFEFGAVPYGKNSRAVIGEKTENSFVVLDAAKESARNLINTFNVYYALAETSAAPRDDVPKSGKQPEIFICAMANDKEIISERHVIDTPFRAEFNAAARELMYLSLLRLYGKS